MYYTVYYHAVLYYIVNYAVYYIVCNTLYYNIQCTLMSSIIMQETTKKLTKKLKNQGKELELLKLNSVSSNPVSASTSDHSTPSPSCGLTSDHEYPDLSHSEVKPVSGNLSKVRFVTYIHVRTVLLKCNIASARK